jgi:chlorite dismutase
MADAPVTLEGWYTAHRIYAVDRARWNALPVGERAAIAAEAGEVLAGLAAPADGHGACYGVVSGKGDLCVVHWRRTLEDLRAAELAVAGTRLAGFLVAAYSYLAVIELGTYELMGYAAAQVKKRGVEPGSPDFDAEVKVEMERMARPRLFPDIPPRRYLCFYPMSKRRGEQVNWYDLTASERAVFMRGHGEIGRKYAGQVTQVIQGSVGLDDWEWGVTLFADDPLVFKKLVYEMRFDPASSRFALFGPFFVGVRLAPQALGAALDAALAAPS